MTRNADRKNAISAYRAEHPGTSYGEATRLLDQRAANAAATTAPSAPSSKVVAALQRASKDLTVQPSWRQVFRRLLTDTENVRLRAPSSHESGRWVASPLLSYQHANSANWLQMTYAYAARAQAMLVLVAAGREPRGDGSLLPGEPPARPNYTPDIDISSPPHLEVPVALDDADNPHLRAAQAALAAIPPEPAAGWAELADEAKLQHVVNVLIYADAIVLYMANRELPCTGCMLAPPGGAGGPR